jgi:hypothetical protein
MTLMLSLLVAAPSAQAQSWPAEPTFCELNPGACPDFTLRADLTIMDITTGCTGSGGDPTISIWVENIGLRSATTYVDGWFGQASAPVIGDWGDFYRQVTVAAGDFEVVTFTMPGQDGASGWIDAIVDTDELVIEMLETNNTDYEWGVLPDCSFN